LVDGIVIVGSFGVVLVMPTQLVWALLVIKTFATKNKVKHSLLAVNKVVRIISLIYKNISIRKRLQLQFTAY
jgi:hypothetical protein